MIEYSKGHALHETHKVLCAPTEKQTTETLTLALEDAAKGKPKQR
jgi:hypothetical protein